MEARKRGKLSEIIPQRTKNALQMGSGVPPKMTQIWSLSTSWRTRSRTPHSREIKSGPPFTAKTVCLIGSKILTCRKRAQITHFSFNLWVVFIPLSTCTWRPTMWICRKTWRAQISSCISKPWGISPTGSRISISCTRWYWNLFARQGPSFATTLTMRSQRTWWLGSWMTLKMAVRTLSMNSTFSE